MGYCEEHDRVYRGDSCPDCSGETGAAASNASGSDATHRNETDRSAEPDEEATDDDTAELDIQDVVDAAVSDAEVETSAGDVVVGDQEKSVSKTEQTEVDNSTERVRKETTEHDDRTVVRDSVVKDSDIGDGDDETVVEDGVSNRSGVGGDGNTATGNDRPDADRDRLSSPGEPTTGSGPETRSEASGTGGSGDRGDGSEFCIYCGAEINVDADTCPACGESLS